VPEPVHCGHLDLDGCPCGDHVHYAAAADRGELPAVPDERDAGGGFVGDGEDRAGAFLVQHPGLINHQQVTSHQPGVRPGAVVDPPGDRVQLTWSQAGPHPVGVPPVPVGVDQAVHGVGLDLTDLRGREHRRFPGRREDPQPAEFSYLNSV
jgi:hypothetical protein